MTQAEMIPRWLAQDKYLIIHSNYNENSMCQPLTRPASNRDLLTYGCVF